LHKKTPYWWQFDESSGACSLYLHRPSSGCSAFLNISAAYLCRRVRRGDRNSRGRDPQPRRSNHKNSFFSPALGADPRKAGCCTDMARPELYELQHRRTFCSLPRLLALYRFPVLSCTANERKQKSNCNRLEHSPAYSNQGTAD